MLEKCHRQGSYGFHEKQGVPRLPLSAGNLISIAILLSGDLTHLVNSPAAFRNGNAYLPVTRSSISPSGLHAASGQPSSGLRQQLICPGLRLILDSAMARVGTTHTHLAPTNGNAMDLRRCESNHEYRPSCLSARSCRASSSIEAGADTACRRWRLFLLERQGCKQTAGPKKIRTAGQSSGRKFGGRRGDRTPDLCIANAALSQLS